MKSVGNVPADFVSLHGKGGSLQLAEIEKEKWRYKNQKKYCKYEEVAG